jgi:hypothetical protein
VRDACTWADESAGEGSRSGTMEPSKRGMEGELHPHAGARPLLSAGLLRGPVDESFLLLSTSPAGEINYAKNLPRVAKAPDLDARFE